MKMLAQVSTLSLGRFALFLTLLAIAQIAFGDDAPGPTSDDLKTIIPFVNEATFLIVKVDPARLSLPNEFELSVAKTPETKALYARAMKTFESALEQLRAIAANQPIYATVDIPGSKHGWPARGFRPLVAGEDVEAIKSPIERALKAAPYVKENYIVISSRMGRVAAQLAAPDATGQAIAAAFTSVDSYPIQVLIVPPAHVWRTVRELSPELPRQLGGGPSQVLTDGVQWISIGVDPGRLRVDISIQSASAEAAAAFSAYLPKMLQSSYNSIRQLRELLPEDLAGSLFDSLKPAVEGSQIELRIDASRDLPANLAVVASIASLLEEQSRRHSHSNKLKQIMLAMHNYHDSYRTFPPIDKYRDADGKHQLSWRVHILPFLEEQALFNQFHLDESWDSPHNKTLVAKMPDVYARSSLIPFLDELKPGYTTFLAPIGDKTIMGREQATTFSKITDGTSNTIAVLDVTPFRAVPWTAPDDYMFDAGKPLLGVKITDDNRWLAAFADGSVRYLSSDLPADTVLHLFQMNDGHPVEVR